MPMSRALPLIAAFAGLALPLSSAWATNFPITPEQRSTAQQVAQSGVPLSDLAPNAPDSHTVVPGDTLWGISSMFLKTPWRWPELWGMNRSQIANPHLIYPGQLLVLVKRDGRAMLQFGQQVSGSSGSSGRIKLSPRIRSTPTADNPVAAIPQHLIEPFLNEAVVLDTNEMATAPRVVAAPEGKVLLAAGDLAYVRGITQPQDSYRLFRSPRPLRDPSTGEILGYEGVYVGAADFTRLGGTRTVDGSVLDVPATLTLRKMRVEAGVNDRLAPIPPRSFSRYIPHAPEKALEGQIISIYGEAVTAGQNQIVALNRGTADGLARGHVLALWRAGKPVKDSTANGQLVQLPDEKHGVLFVFQTFNRVSYALIISVKTAVNAGDRFTSP
ncbi:MAG: LysM peptidoglycan-binding domain-containing protein [Burkholderiales bacterium]